MMTSSETDRQELSAAKCNCRHSGMARKHRTRNLEILRCALHIGVRCCRIAPERRRKRVRLRGEPDTLAENSTRRTFMRRFWTVLAALATLSLANCGYNAIQTNDEQVKSSW